MSTHWLTDLMADPNLDKRLAAVEAERAAQSDPEFWTAFRALEEFKTVLSAVSKFPQLLDAVPGLSYDPDSATLTIDKGMSIRFRETVQLASDKHLRIDSGGDPVPGHPYLHSVFLNTEFKDGEPVFSRTPFAQRPTVLRSISRNRKKLKAGCGCGGRCGGH